MAFGEMNFYSNSLGRNVSFHFLIPGDREMDIVKPYHDRAPKTIYLLHGYSHTSHDWLLQSNITKLAFRYNLNVILPNGENSFWLDQEGVKAKYTQLAGKEIVEYTRKIFGFSDKPEDTFIMGESMGGYGVLHVGMTYPETFSKIAAFAPAMIQHDVAKVKPGGHTGPGDYYYYRTMFGDLDKLLTSCNNPEQQVLDLQAAGKKIPDIYMCCGDEDALLPNVLQFKQYLDDHQVKHIYDQSPGDHDFAFWNQYVEKAIRFFLDEI